MVKKEKKVTRIDPVRTTQPLEQTQEMYALSDFLIMVFVMVSEAVT